MGILSLCLVGLVVTEASAVCQLFRGGKLVCSEMCLDSLIKGVPQVDVNPEHNTVAQCGAIYIDQVLGVCLNQPFNATKAQGTVFSPGITLTAATDTTVENLIDTQGQATFHVCFSGTPDEILVTPVLAWMDESSFCKNITEADGSVCPADVTIDAPFCENQPTGQCGYCSGKGICPNKNWWLDPCSATINVIYAYYSVWQPKSGDLQRSDDICNRCVADPNSEHCGFTCTEVSATECRSKGMDTACHGAVCAYDDNSQLCPPPS
jgi:hypothetical protein